MINETSDEEEYLTTHDVRKSECLKNTRMVFQAQTYFKYAQVKSGRDSKIVWLTICFTN